MTDTTTEVPEEIQALQPKAEWHQHKLGLVAEVDFATGKVRPVATWESLPDHCPAKDPSIQCRFWCRYINRFNFKIWF